MPRTIYIFGIELELLLMPESAPTSITGKTLWEHITHHLSQLFSNSGIDNKIFTGSGKPKYSEWTIVQDGSITQDRQTQAGVELVSNFCYNTQNSEWEADLHKLWTAMRSEYNIVPTDSCGTHVHISLKRRDGWGLERLRWVAKSIIYFERCIDSFMPTHRIQMNTHIKSNRYNENFKHMSMPEIFAAIDGIEAEEYSREGHKKLAQLISPTRAYRWNFDNMIEVKDEDEGNQRWFNKRSIEFRQPPGSLCVEDAIKWPQFTLAFISGAIQANLKLDSSKEATMDDLRHFVAYGAGYTWSKRRAPKDMRALKAGERTTFDDGWIDELFDGKMKLPEGKLPEDGPAQPLSPEKRSIQNIPKLKVESMFEALPQGGYSDDEDEE